MVTVETLLPRIENGEAVSANEIYEAVVRFLAAQGVPSYRVKGALTNCVYRGPNNTRCAAGCLIPDSEYEKWMDEGGNPVLTLFNNKRVKDRLFARSLAPHLDLLQDLQHAHDESVVTRDGEKMFDLAHLRGALGQIEVDHNLTVPDVVLESLFPGE